MDSWTAAYEAARELTCPHCGEAIGASDTRLAQELLAIHSKVPCTNVVRHLTEEED